MDENPIDHFMLDGEFITQVRELLAVPNGVTKYHLYYAPSNIIDTLMHTLVSDLPETSSYPISAPDDYPRGELHGWDHLLLPIIEHMGMLPEIFPPFAAA
jgi:hypothetical protein